MILFSQNRGQVRASSGKLACNNLNYSLYLSSTVIKFVFDSSIINSRYLFHFLLSKDYEIHQCVYDADPKRLSLEELGKIPINLPPIKEQIKLAKVLDNFWKLSEELNEELDLRKKQYEYYSDELLSFKQNNKIKWLTLEEIINKSYKGNYFSKDLILKEGEPCVRYVQLYEENGLHFDFCTMFLDKSKIKNPKYCEYGDVLITSTSRNMVGIAKPCAYLFEKPAIIDSHCIILKHNQNAKYLAHLLSTKNFRKYIKLSSNACILDINFDSIKSIKIPIPSLEKQKGIANLLDKFWKISSNIKEGLPSEILLRKQQYEYYRNKIINLN